jgi:hypothetical protein
VLDAGEGDRASGRVRLLAHTQSTRYQDATESDSEERDPFVRVRVEAQR